MQVKDIFKNSKKFIISKGITFGILAVVVIGILVPVESVFAADNTPGILNTLLGPGAMALESLGFDTAGSVSQTAGNLTFGPLFTIIGSVLMVISSFILTISGWLFDIVIQYTVVDMAKNIGTSTGATQGMGAAINTAWATIRDIANMGFIFILLFAAFKAMFDADFNSFWGKTVKDIIIIALLINFSLFFSKVVIDASNIVSVGFYNAIKTNDANIGINAAFSGGTANFKGISGGYMRMLRMQTWYDANILSGGVDFQKIFLTGFMSSAFMLMTAVIFFIAAIMFASRFIILIFIMVLSPLALIAYTLPTTKSRFSDWLNALINQSFFAPLFFALTWVAFKLGNALISNSKASWTDVIMLNNTNKEGAITLLLNYVLTMGFFVAALIFAKQMASKTRYFTSIAGGVGTATAGLAGFAGRHTIGWGAARIASDEKLKERAAAGDRGARMQLATAKKLAGSSFDVRGVADTKYGKMAGASSILDIAGKASGTGGYAKATETKDEKRRKRTDDVLRQFRNRPEILASHLASLSDSDQKYMYDKLGARDRAAVNEELDKIGPRGTALKDKLMNNMSVEEKEKTAKAGKEAARDFANKTILDQIENFVHGRTIDNNPATGVPYTIDDLISDGGTLPTGWRPLRSNQARKLSNDALRNGDVVRRLSSRHLSDITSDKDDIDNTAKMFIVSLATTPPPYPLQAEQESYLKSTTTIKSYWGIP